MISALVILHAILMTASLLATGVSTLSAFAGYRTPTSLLSCNFVVTTTGVISGILLMLSLPVDVRCIILLGYVVAFALAQVYVMRRNQELSPSV